MDKFKVLVGKRLDHKRWLGVSHKILSVERWGIKVMYRLELENFPNLYFTRNEVGKLINGKQVDEFWIV